MAATAKMTFKELNAEIEFWGTASEFAPFSSRLSLWHACFHESHPNDYTACRGRSPHHAVINVRSRLLLFVGRAIPERCSENSLDRSCKSRRTFHSKPGRRSGHGRGSAGSLQGIGEREKNTDPGRQWRAMPSLCHGLSSTDGMVLCDNGAQRRRSW